MNCSTAEIYISKWADNELEKELIIEVSKHIKDCPKCKDLCRQEFLIADRLSELPTAVPEISVADHVLAGFKKTKKQPGFLTWWKFSGPEIKTAALSIAVAGIIAGFIFARELIELNSLSNNSPYVLAVNATTGGMF